MTAETIAKSSKSVNKNIPIEMILRLRRSGLSQSDIARTLNCHITNISKRLAVYEFYDNFRDNIDDFYELLQHRAFNAITDAKLEKTSAYQLALIISILEDKKRLVRGQNTARIDINSTICSIDTIRKQEQVLEAKYKLLTGKDLGSK